MSKKLCRMKELNHELDNCVILTRCMMQDYEANIWPIHCTVFFSWCLKWNNILATSLLTAEILPHDSNQPEISLVYQPPNIQQVELVWMLQRIVLSVVSNFVVTDNTSSYIKHVQTLSDRSSNFKCIDDHTLQLCHVWYQIRLPLLLRVYV